MFRYFTAAFASFFLFTIGTASAEESYIAKLARKIPASTNTAIDIFDIKVSRDPNVGHLQPDELGSKHRNIWMLYALPSSSNGIDLRRMLNFIHRNDTSFRGAMGFEFDDMDGFATWGEVPHLNAIVEFGAAPDPLAVAAALQARKFSLREADRIWYREKDLEPTGEFFRDDPFSSTSQSERFKLNGTTLYHAKTFADIEAQLAATPKMIDDVDVAAMFAAIAKEDNLGVPYRMSLQPKVSVGAGPNRGAQIFWLSKTALTLTTALTFSDITNANASIEYINKNMVETLPSGSKSSLRIFEIENIVVVHWHVVLK